MGERTAGTGDEGPAGARLGAAQALGGRRPGGCPLLVTHPGGYLLETAPDSIDAVCFEALLADGRRLLADGAHGRAAATLCEALALWRGDAYAGLSDFDFAAAEAARLEELRLVATEARIEADLGLGREAELVAELDALAAGYPLRERIRYLQMLALYRNGRQADALAVYHVARAEMLDQLGIDPSRSLQELERAILQQDSSLQAPARLLPAIAEPSTRLIGREPELRRLLAELATARVVTITGPGGVGKTSIARELAARVQDRYRDGASFVSLGGLTDPELVVAEIAGALGVEQSGTDPVMGAIKRTLTGREALIVLDNFEHVLPAARAVADLRDAAAGLQLLITSREPLRIGGEHEFPLEPLTAPTAGGSDDLTALSENPAAALFVERAAAADPSFTLSQGNASAVAGICDALEGLPLAIELAARRVKLLSPPAILERLQDRLSLLSGGARDAPDRQHSLRATLDWSYELLADEQERVVFARLSTFAGGWDAAAAAHVCQVSEPVVLDRVATLLDKSMVRRLPDGADTARFGMLETIRAYAAERLELGDQVRLADLHSAHYLLVAQEARVRLAGSEQAGWLARMGAEQDNLRAALRHSLETGDAETAVRLAAALERYWARTGQYAEGWRWLSAAVDQADAASPRARLAVLLAAAEMAQRRSDLASAHELFGRALQLGDDIGDADATLAALTGQGTVALWSGEMAAAAAALEPALEATRQACDSYQLTLVLNMLAAARAGNGDYAGSRALLDESLIVSQAEGDEDGVAIAYANLSELDLIIGDHASAEQFASRSIELHRRFGAPANLAPALLNRGLARIGMGLVDQAEADLRESLAIARDAEFVRIIPDVIDGFAVACVAKGDYELAALLAGSAVSVREAAELEAIGSAATFDAALAAARDAIGDDRFDAAWTLGAQAPVEETYALIT